MKTRWFFQSWTQQFSNWWRQHLPLHRFSRESVAIRNEKRQVVADGLLSHWRKLILGGSRRIWRDRSAVIFVIAVVSITGILGHRFYNQPRLGAGTIAPQTIQAPFDARVEDAKSTEAKRQVARTASVPVLAIDSVVNQQTEQELQHALDLNNELRQIAGPFPFAETSMLSAATQLYLRQCPEPQWQTVITAVDNAQTKQPTTDVNLVNTADARAIAELQAYQLINSPPKLAALVATITRARQRYAQTSIKLSVPEVLKAEPFYDPALLSLSDADWAKTETGIHDSAERILTQGIPLGLPQSILQRAVSLQVQTQVPLAAQIPATKLLLSVLKPNLKPDAEQTRLQAQQAASAVAPAMLQVQRGQVIVRAGDVITPQNFVLLDYFKLSRREINWLGLMQLGGMVVGAIGVFGLVERRLQIKLRQRDLLLILLLTLSTPLLVAVGMPYTSLPAIGLLIGNFYGSVLGVTVVGLVTVLLPGSLQISWQHLLAGAAGGLLGSWMAGRLRSREELALLGGAVGLTQGVVYLLGNLVSTSFWGLLWYVVVREALLSGLSGLAWSIVALGLSPYLEHLFDLVTSSRLAELANPNRPLLKQLATQAPGTFQHTLFVATLAEAAAKALNCNVELIRAGTLYHDIGKLHDSLSFIENQMGGPNKHDKINDPWKSAEIIKKHVSAGLAMARKYRLPTALQAFIPEHQGTLLIAYFYYQAQQLAAETDGTKVIRPVIESDFRYDGPIPQSRETGIVMLADACEAALRSLKDAEHDEALALVNRILKARWQDNQLVDSGLKRNEMSQIGEIFVQVWQQFNHKRIAYPKSIK